MCPAVREVRAIEWADVVQAQEASLENVVALAVLAVHPPSEVEQQLVEDPFQKRVILAAIDLENPERHAPSVHWRVDIAKGPFVGGKLAVRMHEPLATKKDELGLGELRVDARERHAVECQIPTPHTTGTPICQAWR